MHGIAPLGTGTSYRFGAALTCGLPVLCAIRREFAHHCRYTRYHRLAGSATPDKCRKRPTVGDADLTISRR